MLRPTSLPPAHPAAEATPGDVRARTVAALLCVLALVLLSSPVPAAAQAAPRPARDEPLQLDISELSPSVLRDGSDVTIEGTLTNASEETWTTVNVHSFVGDAPITDAAALAAAAETPTDEYVGERIVEPGTFVTIPSIAPGESVPFTAVVPRAYIGFTDGVQWVGVHAMGTSDSQPSDTFADGRARSFLPVVQGKVKPLKASLVLPLRAAVHHRPDGSVSNAAAWARRLGPGGRLHNLLTAGREAGDRPVTWLVDPAVPHAVERLAAGNPPRSIAPVPGAEGDDGQGEDGEGVPETEQPAEPSEDPSPTATPPAEPEDVSPAEEAAAAAAEAWLAILQAELSDHPVLALPFGDLDVSAVQEVDDELYLRAVQRSTEVMDGLGIPSAPALSAPDGYLSPRAIESASPGTLVLLTDQALVDPEGGSVPSTGTLLGQTFATTSSGVAAGGPGPEPAGGPVAVRQRVVSEAALQLLAGDDSPLVIVPPPSWDPASSVELYDSFDDGLLRLRPLGDVVDASAAPQPPETLVYTDEQAARQLPADNVRSAQLLVGTATRLESILTRPSTVVAQVGDVALTDLSYFSRRSPDTARLRTIRSRSALSSMLASVRIDGPPSVILSGDQGSFGVTVSNGLGVPVTVHVTAETDGSVDVSDPPPVELAPQSRRRLRLAATTTQQGTRTVTVKVTDAEGTPLGDSASFPLRSAQVSGIFWVIMAGGMVMLFGAIVVRLVRRVRAARRPGAEPTA